MATSSGVYNEALWAAFLERANIMELRQLPPREAVMQRTGPVDLEKVVNGKLHPPLERVAVVPDAELAAELHAGADFSSASGSSHTHGKWQGAASVHAHSSQSLADAAWYQLNCRGLAPHPWCTRAHPEESDRQPVLVDEQQQQQQGGGSCTHPLARGRWQRFFSLYVKAPPLGRVPADSLFCGHAVHSELDLTGEYGQFALAQAVVDLMAVALQDPMNLQFVVISESSVPVRPPELFWAQLVWETKSRIHACGGDTHTARWHDAMETGSLNHWHWRKSPQWISLTREHAALAVADRHVIEMFRRYCYTGIKGLPTDRATPDIVAACLRNHGRARHALVKTHMPDIANCSFARSLQAVTELLAGGHGDRPLHAAGRQSGSAEQHEPAACHDFLEQLHRLGHGRVCIADEHYFPTLLSSYHLEHQTDCCGAIHYAEWEGWHPYSFKPDDFSEGTASPDRFLNTRGHASCDGIEAMRSLQGLFQPIPCEAATSGNSGGSLGQRVTFPQKRDTKQQQQQQQQQHNIITSSGYCTANHAQHQQHKRRQLAEGHMEQQQLQVQLQPKWRRRLTDDRQQGLQARRQLEEQQKQVTLSSWLEDTIGFKPMDSTLCPVAMRKVPAGAADAAFRFFMECEGGMGLGARCSWA